MKNRVKLIIAIAIPQIVAAAAAYFTVTGVGTWYQTIKRPEWNPPNWIFGPVWTVLYILMGIALYFIWKSPSAYKQVPVLLWSAQLTANFVWSFLFFGQHQIGWAMADIVLLWILILLTVFSFSKLNRTAAWLLVPYICWVSFAALLNYAIWMLNK